MAMQSTQHLLLLLLAMLLATAQPQPLPNCTRKCGSVEIPYPFGTTEGCYLDTPFLITCNQTSSGSPPTPFLQGGKTTVLNISLDGELRISLQSAKDCYDDSVKLTSRETSGLKLSHFQISSTRNKLTAIGCDTLGLIKGHDGSQRKNYNTGCASFCNTSLDEIVANGTCTGGTGCCEASIPEGLSTVVFSSSHSAHTTIHDFNPCGYAFLVEEGAYNFVSTDVENLQRTMFPVVVDWSVGNQTCQQAKKNRSSYACVAENSYCSNSKNGPGYRCYCSDGFRGNPYLPDGCKEINKCLESNNCINGAICHNFRGGYNCLCPKGHKGDGKIDGTGCLPKLSTNSRTVMIILIIALCLSLSLLALLLGSFYVYWGMKKRKFLKLKEIFFEQNGGILLQQQIASHGGSSTETARVFTEEELKEATNNFDERKVLGQGYYGTVYKGELLDKRLVAIKKSKINNPNQIEQFINELIVLSQINHRNVVKLLGFCLETEVPLLVYEFIPNGTISQHLHCQTQSLRLSWETRLRIATETAGALAYFHSAASTPIIHRDVKTSNILLDSDLTAKVSDFGASRLVPLDQSQLITFVQGTLGYLDPEYVDTGILTVKSDVYSFGVVLAELITGKKALSFSRPESDRNLAMYFVSSMKDGRLIEIVDNQIINEANIVELEQVMEVANITKRCLSMKGKERPTMKEVAMELEGLRIMIKNSVEMSSDEYLFYEDSFPYNVVTEDGVGPSAVNSGLYSFNRVSMILSGGR